MGIKQNKLPLAAFIAADFKDFDPAHPDSAATLDLDPLFDNGSSQHGGDHRQYPGPGQL